MDDIFEAIGPEEWRQLIEKELKSLTYEDVKWPVAEGVEGKPDYSAKDAPEPVVFIPADRPAEGWLIKENLSISSFDDSNKAALDLLMKGVNAMGFRGTINRSEDLRTLLHNIDLPAVGLFFSRQNQPLHFLQNLSDYVRSRSFPSEKITGGMSFDPVGMLATRGNWINNEIRDRELCIQLLEVNVENNMHQFHPVFVDGSIYHNSGADVVTELACTLAHGNEYLQWLHLKDQDIRKAAAGLHFKLAAGRAYFAQIAKFRAFRPLWANVCAAYDIEPKQSSRTFVTADTSLRERSLRDPHTNLIRTTTQAMTAVLGGCDAIRVVPFDDGLSAENSAGSRLARNIQLILNEEAHFGIVADPSAGSYLFDRLSAEVMEAAWKLFQEIEERGGLVEGLKSGFIQEKIKSQADRADEKIASGDSVYVGLNKYQDAEEPVHIPDSAEGFALESKQIEPLPLRDVSSVVEHANHSNS